MLEDQRRGYSGLLLARWALRFSLERASSIFLLAASMCSSAVFRLIPIREAISASPSPYSHFSEAASCCFSVKLCMYCDRSVFGGPSPSKPFNQCFGGLFGPPACPPTVASGIAPAAAISSFRTVSIAVSNSHKNTRRAPLSSKRVCAAPNLCSELVSGTCSVFSGPMPTVGATLNSQAGARQDFGDGRGGAVVGMDIESGCPGTNSVDTKGRTSHARMYQLRIHSSAAQTAGRSWSHAHW